MKSMGLKRCMGTVILWAGLASLALTAAPPSALAATPSQTTGGVSFNLKSGKGNATVNLQVNAYRYADGSLKGQQQYSSTALTWHGATPVCYVLVNPTTAVFAGPITTSSNPSLVGEFYVIEAVDNSPAAPNQIGVMYTTKTPTCTFHGQLNTVTGGSLVVH